MKTYEYDLIWNVTNLEDLKKELNGKARDGWKVVGVLEGMIIILEKEK